MVKKKMNSSRMMKKRSKIKTRVIKIMKKRMRRRNQKMNSSSFMGRVGFQLRKKILEEIHQR